MTERGRDEPDDPLVSSRSVKFDRLETAGVGGGTVLTLSCRPRMSAAGTYISRRDGRTLADTLQSVVNGLLRVLNCRNYVVFPRRESMPTS
jgi:hypothetical protein